MNLDFDVIIVGAGASGICCAISSLAQGKTVAVLEHNTHALKKVQISGGGRCNFTNMEISQDNFFTKSAETSIISKTLNEFTPKDFINIVNKHNIGISEKAKGQLFTSESSKKIIDMLLNEAKKAKIFYNTNIKSIKKDNITFYIETNRGTLKSKTLVVATGGLSYPNIGASDFGYIVAKQFGLRINPYKPALVPFNLDNEIMKDTIKLKGVSVEAEVKCYNKSFRDNILFTHFGLSGPAILQASLYWNKGDKININMLPEINVAKELKILRDNSKGKKISNILAKYLPNRLVDFILKENDCFITEASNKLIADIANKINSWEVIPIGTQGYKLAEVTSGGVDLDEINPNFETKKISKLFFVGEVLDVTGQVGGYNLQWAWSSGFIAGKHT